LRKNSPACQVNSAQARIADSQFQKRSQLFIGTLDVPLSVAAMRLGNDSLLLASNLQQS
jgi:hypothetical protein